MTADRGKVPQLRLNNGVEIPALGFGVFQTPPGQTIAAVEAALATGYRHIDTAAAYGNEREVGEAIRRSGVDRSEILIETKVWITDYGYDQTLHAFDKSAGKLGIDQIDLLILHQALPGEFDLTIGAYQALETLLGDGKVRAIGVSNFMPDHLSALLAATSVVPAVNQIEVHPYFRQFELLAVNGEHGILSQAWSPIGGITFYRDGSHGSTLQDAVINDIAAAHGKTPAPGDAALAPAAGPPGDPEVGDTLPDRRELRHLRLRAHRRPARRDRCPRHRRSRRPRAGADHPRGVRSRHSRGLRSAHADQPT
jgi:2,5-diketo-D-gluconate reductase A